MHALFEQLLDISSSLVQLFVALLRMTGHLCQQLECQTMLQSVSNAIDIASAPNVSQSLKEAIAFYNSKVDPADAMTFESVTSSPPQHHHLSRLFLKTVLFVPEHDLEQCQPLMQMPG